MERQLKNITNIDSLHWEHDEWVRLFGIELIFPSFPSSSTSSSHRVRLTHLDLHDEFFASRTLAEKYLKKLINDEWMFTIFKALNENFQRNLFRQSRAMMLDGFMKNFLVSFINNWFLCFFSSLPLSWSILRIRSAIDGKYR